MSTPNPPIQSTPLNPEFENKRTALKDSIAKNDFNQAKSIQTEIFTLLRIPEGIITAAKENITKNKALISKEKKDDRQKITPNDEEKLELALRFAAIAAGIISSLEGKTEAERKAALAQIGMLQALIRDIAASSTNLQPEIEALNNEISRSDYSEPALTAGATPAPGPDSDDTASSADGSDNYPTVLNDTPTQELSLSTKPNSKYAVFSSIGTTITVTVTDGKTKLRIPSTEGLDENDKIKLAKSFVETALIEGAYTLESGVPKFTLNTKDDQFRKAVRAQIEDVLGYKCVTPGFDKPTKGGLSKMLGLDSISDKVLKYNKKVLGIEDSQPRPIPDPVLRINFLKAMIEPREKTQEDMIKELEDFAPASLFNIIPGNKAKKGHQKLAENMYKYLSTENQPLSGQAALTLVTHGAAGYNYDENMRPAKKPEGLKSNGLNPNYLSEVRGYLIQMGIARAQHEVNKQKAEATQKQPAAAKEPAPAEPKAAAKTGPGAIK